MNYLQNTGDYSITTLSALRRGSYTDSLERFFRDAWRIIEPETQLKFNWHLEYLCHELEFVARRIVEGRPREQHLIINVPPATTKSTLITIVFPVWCWTLDPSMKFLTFSYAADLALRHAVKSRDIIRSNWFQDLFGGIFQLKYDVNKKSEYENDRSGHRIAAGVGGGATGKHGDINIVDDPSNPKQALSPVEIEKVNYWGDNTLANRFTDPLIAQKILVMQRLARNDLTGHYLSKGDKYRHICLPAEKSIRVKPVELLNNYDGHGGLLDPVRLSKRVLDDFYVELGARGYAGQYGQTPTAEEGNLIKPEWVRYFEISALSDQAFSEDEPLNWDFYIDGAYTEDITNAPTAVLVAARFKGSLYVRNARRVWMELPDLIKFLPEFARNNGYTEGSRIIIEPKASGLSIGQSLRAYTSLNVVIDKPPKAGKTERLKDCTPFIEGGRFYVLRNGEFVPMYLDELKAAPFADYWDLTDCTTMAVLRAKIEAESDEIFDMQAV